MSGPIVRKYGFPNFDEIFGKRELQHGVDDPPAPAQGEATAGQEKPQAGTKPADAKPADPPKSS